VGKLVLSQLSLQLPQNLGASGKGNWSLSGRLQPAILKWPAPTRRRLTTQPALHCDQWQKLENKNRKVICVSNHLCVKSAGTNILQIFLSRGKLFARFCRDRRIGSGLARAGTRRYICLHLPELASDVTFTRTFWSQPVE
jgi:hypothetical protein